MDHPALAGEKMLHLGGEAASLIAVIRQNESWSEFGLDPFLADLQRLRREAYRNLQLWSTDPYRCFSPFIQVTSGMKEAVFVGR